MSPRAVQRVYLTLMLGNTLAASLIWGINTIFLLDAGLSNLEAFAANAFFTAGMLIFEVPTGIIADTLGRRSSYLLGTVTLVISTLLYVALWQFRAPFWPWAVTSMLMGLGFTFFSGAVEAWLVDALKATGYRGDLERVFGKGQMVSGGAMLVGSVAGGLLAQATNLGVPFVLRSVILGGMFVAAFLLMRDIGFKPRRTRHPFRDVRRIFSRSVDYGLRNPPVRWLMLAGIFAGGVGIYTFYALQPYVLELYGDDRAYAAAGLVAAVVAAAQIAGGYSATHVRRLFRRRTTALLVGTTVNATALVLIGLTTSLPVVLLLVVVSGLVFAGVTPIRQAYLNGLIPSRERATVLSFDSLMASSGGVVIQPVLGRVADVWSYGISFVAAGVIDLLAMPFLLLARRERAAGDREDDAAPTPVAARGSGSGRARQAPDRRATRRRARPTGGTSRR